MTHKLFATDNDFATSIVRLVLGIIFFAHGAQKGEGFEYHLLTIAVAILLMIRGAGAASIDRWIAGRRTRAVVAQGAR